MRNVHTEHMKRIPVELLPEGVKESWMYILLRCRNGVFHLT